MEDEFERQTESAGSLDPPSRKPPTAVATATPGPDNPGGTKVRALLQAGPSSWLGKWINAALDTVDSVADVARDVILSATRR